MSTPTLPPSHELLGSHITFALRASAVEEETGEVPHVYSADAYATLDELNNELHLILRGRVSQIIQADGIEPRLRVLVDGNPGSPNMWERNDEVFDVDVSATLEYGAYQAEEL